MIIHQRSFFCKVGHADQVVQSVRDFKRIADGVGVTARSERVYTDLTGKNDQVIWQIELDSMAAWEDAGGKFYQHADFSAWFEKLTAHIEGSDSQFFRMQ
jgi:hypothetical protein